MNEQSLVATHETVSDLPWLVFKLQNLLYSVNSRIVNGILQYPEDVTPVSSAPDTFRGIINYREAVMPLLDLRKVFNIESSQEDLKILVDTTNTMRSEMTNYYNMVTKYVLTGEMVADFITPETTTIYRWAAQAEKHLSDGITKFHSIPVELIDVQHTMQSNGQELMTRYEKGRLVGVSVSELPEFKALKKALLEADKIVRSAVEDYQSGIKEMIVAVTKGKSTIGLIVDEVVAVDDLNIVSDETNFPKFQQKRNFVGVAHNAKIAGDILLLNEDMLMEACNEFDNFEETE